MTNAAILDAIDEEAERLISVVSSAPDVDRRVPTTPAWTVAGVFAHVVTVVPRYEQGAVGAGEWADTPGGVPELNDRELERLDHRRVEDLVDRLRASLGSLRTTIEALDDRVPTFRFHGGAQIRADTALGILLGELVIHGHDIAGAVGRQWPIAADRVTTIVEGVNPILPGWLDPARTAGHTATYELRLRGGPSYVYEFTDGRLVVDPEEHRPVDVHVSADPAALLLVLYKRRSQWPFILRGRLIAWGRRPWLAFSFGDRFHQP